MKISVIGASGFIGKYLSKNMPNNFIVNKIKLRGENLSKLSEKKIKSIFSSEIILNCAASLSPKTQNDFFLNEKFVSYLLHLNKTHQKKIIHLSSINTLVKDRIDSYSLTKKKSEKKIIKSKNLIIIRLPLVIREKNNVLQAEGNISKLFAYLDSIKIPIYPMIYPGHIYQPIEIGLVKKKIIELIKKNNKYREVNLVGNKKISLWDMFKRIANMKNKKVYKIDLRCFYKIMPKFIKSVIKKQNNFLQQIATIDHSNFD